MKQKIWRHSFLIGLMALFYGCQATPQADSLKAHMLNSFAQKHLIESVPFYPQQEFYCGPTTLSEVFNYYGTQNSPETIAPNTFIPKQQGTLQVEMSVAARQHGFLAYSDSGTLSKIISLVSDNIPVIVFQNVSTSWFPQWHYALVIGYDIPSRKFILHTGLTPKHLMSFELFERTWARGEYWMLAPLPPEKISKYLDPFIFINAAYDMLNIANEERGIHFLKSATKQWPENWLPYFLIANHFIETTPVESVKWFSLGLEAGQSEPAYLNNYSIALLNIGEHQAAMEMIKNAILRFNNEPMLRATKAKIESESHLDLSLTPQT
jgi:tetratricopeptide (TPR) repeat protein